MQATAASRDAERSHELETGGCVRPEGEGTSKHEWLAPALSFVTATAIACYQNFFVLHTRATFYGDSRHYLETCGQLVAALRSNFGEALTATGTSTGTSLASNLMLDGPIITLPAAAFFAILGKIPTPLDWQWFTAAGCLTHGVNALLTCLLARSLTNSKSWALLAGLAWALYPAAIVASERYLTEIPATTLLLALVLASSKLVATDGCNGSNNGVKDEIFEAKDDSRGPSSRLGSNSSRRADSQFASLPGTVSLALLAGILSGLLLLLKPALLPAAVAIYGLLVVCVRTWNRRAVSTLCIVAGIAVVLLPWALSTKAMTGVICLTPQRVPAYNLAMGCNVKVDGWGAMPVPQSTEELAKKARVSLAGTLFETSMSSPVEIANLFLRKLSRLWFYPWNDFRASVLGISAQLQEWWHSALVGLSVTGLLAVAAGSAGRSPLSERKREAVATFVGGACVLGALSHLIYIPFETIARYGHSSVPYLVILAVYGLFNIRTATQRVPLLLVAALALTLAASCKINMIAHLMSFTDFRTALAIIFASRLALIGLLFAATCKYFMNAAQTRRVKVLSIAFSTFISGVIVAMLFSYFIDARNEREWSANLQPGKSVGRTIHLPAANPAGGADSSYAPAAVLIDGDVSLRQATITVNGHVLSERPELLLRLCPGDTETLPNARYIVSKVGMSVDEVRNWWAVRFPASLLKSNGPNEITIANRSGAPLKIYGDYRDTWSDSRRLPSIGFFSPTEFFSLSDKTEGRLPNFVETKSAASESYANSHQGEQDLSDEVGVQSGDYRICLMIGKAQPAPALLDNRPATFSRKLKVADFDQMLGSTISGSELRMNKYVLKHAMRLDARIAVPPEVAQAPFVRVLVSGMVRSVKHSGITSVVLSRVSNESPKSSLLAGTPPFIRTEEHWKRFEIRDLIAPAQYRGGLRILSIKLFPGAWESVSEYGCDKNCGDALFKDIRITLEPLDEPGLDGSFDVF